MKKKIMKEKMMMVVFLIEKDWGECDGGEEDVGDDVSDDCYGCCCLFIFNL